MPKVLKLIGSERSQLHPVVFGGEAPWVYRLLTDKGEQLWPEAPGLRRQHSKRFQSPDGRTHLMIAGVEGKPWHYRPDGLNGVQPYQDVDLSNPDSLKGPYLLTRTPGIGYTFQPRESGTGSITVEMQGVPVSLAGQAEYGRVTYANVATQLDVYTQATPCRYGIFKVLKGPNAPRAFEFLVSWTQLPTQSKTKLRSYNAAELVTAWQVGLTDLLDVHFPGCMMPARMAWDAKGRPVEVRLTAKYDSQAKKVKLTEEVLLPAGYASWAAFDAWPVTVDTDVSYFSSTNDGYIFRYGDNYRGVRDYNDYMYQAVDSAGTALNVGQDYDGLYHFYRASLPFDTSGLPDDADITAASIGLYGQADASTTDFNITAVQYTGSVPITTSDANFAAFGSTSGGTLTTAGFKTNGYNVLTLDATGRGWISKTGTTNIGLRSSRDIASTTPTGSEYVSIYSANQSGTDKDPYIAVTYAEAGEEHSGTAAISGGGSVAATGKKGARATATLSSGGSVAATGVKAVGGTASISGGGNLDLTGKKGAFGTVTISGGGSVSVTGVAFEGEQYEGTAQVSGGGSIIVLGAKQARGPPVLISSGGDVTAQGAKAALGVAEVSGGGTIAAQGIKASSGIAAISGGGFVTTTGTTLLGQTELQRKVGEGEWLPLVIVDDPQVSYDDEGPLQDGVIYYYRARHRAKAGEPSAPILVAEQIGSIIRLTWGDA